jgi:HD-GYP domain-containing protein (c-di-GMP phosphodiesterase class II)
LSVAKKHPQLLTSKEGMSRLQASALTADGTTDFDLFVEIQGQLTLYAPAPYQWSRAEIDRLVAAGHGVLFYFTADEPKVQVLQRLAKLPPIPTKGAPGERITGIVDVAAELTRILYEYPLSASSLAKGREVANGLVDCVREDNTCVSALTKLAHHDYYTYYHSARVAAYSLALAMQLTQKEESLLQELAFGCVLHDVGKTKIDLAILNKPGTLAPDEMKLLRRHPEMGQVEVQKGGLSLVPLEIILHHHERLDGVGYPHGLKAGEIIDEVKIASFADVFDALTTNRPYQQSRSRFRLMDGLDRDAFRAMVEIFEKAKVGPKAVVDLSGRDRKE